MVFRNKTLTFLSLFLLPVVAGVIYVDLAGVFSFSDVSFVIAFIFYVLYVLIQKTSSKTTFVLALLMLIWTALSYIPTGASSVTERIAQWFYLFFVCGLIQYWRDVWR